MNNQNLMIADNLETLEQYCGALVVGMVSLKTLSSFHEIAMKLGILDEDEAEKATTIVWEFRRLLSLYHGQLEQILERVEISQEDVVEGVRNLMPEIKKGRKRRGGKKT